MIWNSLQQWLSDRLVSFWTDRKELPVGWIITLTLISSNGMDFDYVDRSSRKEQKETEEEGRQRGKNCLESSRKISLCGRIFLLNRGPSIVVWKQLKQLIMCHVLPWPFFLFVSSVYILFFLVLVLLVLLVLLILVFERPIGLVKVSCVIYECTQCGGRIAINCN